MPDQTTPKAGDEKLGPPAARGGVRRLSFNEK